MHVRWALWAVSALALGGIAVADPAPQPAPAAKASPPLDAYGRLPSLEQAAISPDGKYLAYVATTNDARRVIVQRLGDGGTLVAGLNVSKTKLRGLQWADNTHLLITTSTTAEVMGLENPAQEWYLLQSFDVVTRKQTPLMEHADSSMNVVVDDPVVRVIGGKTVVFAQGEHFSGRTGTIGLYRVDPVSGVTTVIKPGSDDTVDWFVDNAGEAAAEARYNEPSGRWTLLVRLANGHWTQSKVVDAPIGRPEMLGYAKDGKSLLVRTNEDHKSVFPRGVADRRPVGTSDRRSL